MARYGVIWLEIAQADYASLPAPTREQISERIEQLLENPPTRDHPEARVTAGRFRVVTPTETR